MDVNMYVRFYPSFGLNGEWQIGIFQNSDPYKFFFVWDPYFDKVEDAIDFFRPVKIQIEKAQ